MTEDTSNHLINAVHLSVANSKRGKKRSCEKLYFLSSSHGDGDPPIIAISNSSNLALADVITATVPTDSSDNGTIHITNDFDVGQRLKKARLESNENDNPYKTMLAEIQRTVLRRLRTIQKKMDTVTQRCRCIEEKMDSMADQLQEAGINTGMVTHMNKKSGTVIVGLPQTMDGNNRLQPLPNVGPNVTLITLNSEEDFPNGTWLGDENNPELRVRCHILPSDLSNINRTCHTPEKMALTLLDYLFDRETQACSNISGLGKHGKRQLDPLMIYGIRCHLLLKFNVTEADWHRIKQNLDSKCRTAFRRKQKGMPLTVKAFRDKWVPQEPSVRLPATTYAIQMVSSPSGNCTGSANGLMGHTSDLNVSELTSDSLDLVNSSTVNIPVHLTPSHGRQSLSIMMEDMGEPQIIHMPQGDIQLVHATPEQIAQFQQSGQIQVLAGSLIEASPDNLSNAGSP